MNIPIRKFKCDNFNIKKTTGKGLLDFEYTKQKISAHKNTWRMLIIGPSNSGKTTIFTNSIPYFPRPINSVTYIGPTNTLEDEAPQKLGIILEKSGINWNPINVDKGEFINMPDMEKPEIVVFDDLYKNKNIETLVDATFIRGRHNGQHGVYITQSAAFVPSSVRNNYTYLVLHKSLFNEEVEKKFALAKGTLTDIPITGQEPSNFITLLKITGEITWYNPPIYKNTSNVFKVFKSLPKHNLKSLPSKEIQEVKQGIYNAGNKNALLDYPPPLEVKPEMVSRFVKKFIDNSKTYRF
jgi:hypothetical protein